MRLQTNCMSDISSYLSASYVQPSIHSEVARLQPDVLMADHSFKVAKRVSVQSSDGSLVPAAAALHTIMDARTGETVSSHFVSEKGQDSVSLQATALASRFREQKHGVSGVNTDNTGADAGMYRRVFTSSVRPRLTGLNSYTFTIDASGGLAGVDREGRSAPEEAKVALRKSDVFACLKPPPTSSSSNSTSSSSNSSAASEACRGPAVYKCTCQLSSKTACISWRVSIKPRFVTGNLPCTASLTLI